MNHGQFCDLLKAAGFNFYTGVPCSILRNVIDYLSTNEEFIYVPATREDEAFGIAVGAYMGGKKPVVLMQNSGLGVSINALTSLVLLYRFPVLLIVTWRGYEGKGEPEHTIMGRHMLDFLRVMDVPTKILRKGMIEKQLVESVQTMSVQEVPVALILKEGVID